METKFIYEISEETKNITTYTISYRYSKAVFGYITHLLTVNDVDMCLEQGANIEDVREVLQHMDCIKLGLM